MRKFSEQYAKSSGTNFCVDKSVTAVVIQVRLGAFPNPDAAFDAPRGAQVRKYHALLSPFPSHGLPCFADCTQHKCLTVEPPRTPDCLLVHITKYTEQKTDLFLSQSQGLAEHKDTLGAPLCPCRHYDDKEAEVASGFWNCPCVPMRERKECHCMLFLTEDNDFAGDEKTITMEEVKELSEGM
jgi:ferredoxin-thioredoxin reductase catalytic chain